MNKPDNTADFDPDGVGQANGRLFGLPIDHDDSRLVILPVPWDVTVSYRDGCARGPAAILEASPQLDFHDPDLPDAWRVGFFLDPIRDDWVTARDALRGPAARYIRFLEGGGRPRDDREMQTILDQVNDACGRLADAVERRCDEILDQGRFAAVLGGDHSTPLGLLRSLARRHRSFGVLQVDAHADLREAYEGFIHSHASIARNFLRLPQVTKCVQVGVRDLCRSEAEFAASQGKRVKIVHDHRLKAARFAGKTWDRSCRRIVESLPKKVYLSIDIDGLDPKLCPHTGTPVPGGLEFEELVHLLRVLVDSGRRIIGFDLVEVAPGPDEWDANVGARLLWKLCVMLAKSQGLGPAKQAPPEGAPADD